MRKDDQVEIREKDFQVDSEMGDTQLAQGAPLAAVMEGM